MIAMNCPLCGGKLETTQRAHVLKCLYCDTEVMLDNPTSNIKVEGLVNRGYDYLKDKKFDEAKKVFNIALNHNLHDDRALLGVVLANMALTSVAEFQKIYCDPVELRKHSNVMINRNLLIREPGETIQRLCIGDGYESLIRNCSEELRRQFKEWDGIRRNCEFSNLQILSEHCVKDMESNLGHPDSKTYKQLSMYFRWCARYREPSIEEKKVLAKAENIIQVEDERQKNERQKAFAESRKRREEEEQKRKEEEQNSLQENVKEVMLLVLRLLGAVVLVGLIIGIFFL